MSLTIKHEDNIACLGEDDHLELAQKVTFAEIIYRTLSEQTPTSEQLKVFELILNLAIDHGPDSPSAKKTIAEAEKGETISEAVAAGIEQINDSHGGAIEPCMKILYEMQDSNLSAVDLVKKFREADMKLPGYGHRIYEIDPRAQLILKAAEEAKIGLAYIQLAKDLEAELKEQTKKTLPLNIDGAIAVVLCGLGWEPRLSKAVFIISRSVGLSAHFLNSQPTD